MIGSSDYDDWIELRTNPGDHPISPGYSGSGLVLDGGEEEIVGIVVYGHIDTEHHGTRVAWMLPVARIIEYIPGIGQFVSPEDGDGAAIRKALADEVARLFAGEWCGTAVITGGGSRAVRSWSACDLAIDAVGRAPRRCGG